MSRWGLTLILVAACMHATSNFNGSGMSRAQFDLNCQPDKIEVTVIQEHCGLLGCAGSVVGVRGCGKQTTYANNGATWARGSEVQTIDPPAASTLPATSAPAPGSAEAPAPPSPAPSPTP